MAADEPRKRFPGRAQIDAYGNGGFRFADMSHRGSLLILPSGISAWDARSAADIDSNALAPVLAEAGAIDFLVIGAGAGGWAMPDTLRAELRAHAIAVEILPTPAAVRTYNILFAENRRVAAALIAVG